MKNILLAGFAVFTILTGCRNNNQKTSGPEVIETKLSSRSMQTEKLLDNLSRLSQQGYMFGHHDDTLYGIGWEGDEDRSDVQSVVGDYPAVISYDLGGIELGWDESLDKIPLDKIREEVRKQYKRGGLNSVSWHLYNPVTGGDSWDVSDSTVVSSVLPGGNKYVLYQEWLVRLADYLNSLTTETGEKISVLFRPYHEHTGSWFWWGRDLCTPEEYKQLWSMTKDFLNSKGADHLLYAYSPSQANFIEGFTERYPGNDQVDLLGVDIYHMNGEAGTTQFVKELDEALSVLDRYGKQYNKPVAVTETGSETIPVANWWTEVLSPALDKYPIVYVLVWRNARERPDHYYAPYPVHSSAEDFVKFYNNPETLFVNDVNLYN